MDDTQTVVTEPDAKVMPSTEEVSNAQNNDVDLDELVKSFVPKDEAEPAKNETTANPSDINDVLEFVRLQKVEAEREFERKIHEKFLDTVKSVKGDLPIGEKLVSGYLHHRIAGDQALLKAYQYRDTNPEAWKKVEGKLRGELRDQLGNKPDEASSSTRNLVAEAIKSANSTGGEIAEKPLSEMSDLEFEQYHNKFIRG